MDKTTLDALSQLYELSGAFMAYRKNSTDCDHGRKIFPNYLGSMQRSTATLTA